ncbi:hypothetical protein FALBO_2296 [Fusarium albosuccineum]|uniref:C2H2-type domain-containing protein n=1 Tax=Fusarium albosuccineum TaxID=1237068 RepID=A0A8H4LJM3_9HYPO|nr:hypothetical protein FALBO_2296 [Fusarium albosuccineum]
MTVYGSHHDAEMFFTPPPSTGAGAFQDTFQTPFKPTSSDVFIALMGMTGAGKSTFISHCTEEEVRISEPGALESCTQEVRVHKCGSFSPYANVYLVDTPGFDDTNRKDTDILKEIASWLTETYQQQIKLRGILYLHRISDNRMGGCAHKNLVMFKRLCGTEGIKNVNFVTTHWEKVDQIEGERREKTLQSTKEFWGFFVEKGAAVSRHQNNRNSALSIVQQFVPGWAERPPEEVKLAIQTEMVDSGKDLNNTAAGQELQGEIEKEREKMQREMKEREREMREALATRDKEMFEFLREEQENQRAELRRRSREMDDLKISMEKMHEEKIRRLEARLQQQHQDHLEYRQSVSRREKEHLAQIEQLKAEHATERSRQENLMNRLKDQMDQMKRQPPQQPPQQYNSNRQQQAYQPTQRQPDYQQAYRSYRPANVSTPKDNSQANRKDYKNRCLTCGEYFSRRDDLFEHLEKKQHGRDIKTGKPEAMSTTQNNSNQYLEKSYDTCLTCGKRFNDRDRLFSHLRAMQHGRDIYTGKPERM